MFVKVCGLKTERDIEMAAKYGYDAIGIVVVKRSSRYVNIEKAIELSNYCKLNFPKLKTVAVGISFADVAMVQAHFDFVQIYENSHIENLIYASFEYPSEVINSEYFVYDASMGSGKLQEIPNWLDEINGKIIIAGGLAVDNVAKIINQTKSYCYGVDVSSGVETYGVKDYIKMEKFISEVRNGEK